MNENEVKSSNLSDTQQAQGLDLGRALGVGGPEIKEVDKAENFRATVVRLIKYLKPQYPMLIAMILIAGIGAWFAIWVPDIMKKVTDALANSIEYFIDIGRPPDGNNQLYSYIAPILWTCAALYVLNALFQFTSGLIAASMSQRVVRRMRNDVKHKLDKVPLSYFDATPTGDVIARFTIDIEMISTTLQDSVNQIITGVTTVIGVFVMMVRIDWLLSIIALVSLPILIVVSALIVKKSQKEFAKQQERIGILNGHIEEMYTAHNIVKLYNHEKESIETYEKINKDLKRATRKSQFLASIILPSIKFIDNLVYVGICVGGGLRAGSGIVTIGDIQALLSYTRQFAQPIENISNIANTIQSAIAAAERVFQVFDLEEMTPEGSRQISVAECKGTVDIEHVAFSYDKDKPLITDLSLHVNAGESIAIVGPTGAGKTTLVNLLMRFYDIDKGKISIDGVDINEYSRSDLRSLYGMVLQDTWLFNGSVADNIAYGNPGATREEIIEAAKEAHADQFIVTMEHGYDTELKEGATNISAGQRQLLTIARAILKKPRIIILDEATSSVDTRTEKYVQSAMLAMMKDKTSFVIAHRLSTIKHAAVILVMNHGDVVEQGNHETLMAKKGFYYELYNAQFAGVSDENRDDDTATARFQQT